MSDTIFARSSGAPPAAIAIVRVSGSGAFAAAEALAGSLPQPRTVSVRTLRDPADDTLLDRALVLAFAAPATATGEDLVELHLHGGRAVVAAVEQALAKIDGLRAAAPGEFTRRALANGRIDLTEAEGLADLLAAETEAQRRQALAHAEGGLRRAIEDWTTKAIALAAQVEAVIDHDDEDDVDAADRVIARVRGEATTLGAMIAEALAQPPAERLRDGIRVVLAGPPNSGKSSLLNALAAREAAIVSSIAGTTRDRIEVPVVHGGVAWVFTDTAGLAERTDDPIEAIGVSRARDAIADADIVLWLGNDPAPGGALALFPRADIRSATDRGERLAVSAVTGAGLIELWQVLHARAVHILPKPDALALNQRQASTLRRAGDALTKAAAADGALIIAEELRSALAAFDALTGRAGVEEILDNLFARFCIGK